MSIEIRNLTKRYKAETVLDDISLEVPAGQTLALFGPSGAGKTVLLRCIAGAVDPEAGSIHLGGEDMTQTPPQTRGVGMAFQNFALFPHMSAFDNIASPLTARREAAPTLKERVGDVARLLKIDHVLGHAPRELSNGQKQRTALGRALAAEPDVLLLDDPLRNVDAKLRFEMRLELPRLLADRGATVIYVTQDFREAMALGDRIAVLDQGKLSQVGTPEEIYDTPATVEIARLFGDPTINLLDVTPVRSGDQLTVEISGKALTLPEGYDAEGQACILGIRPELLSFTDDPSAIPVEIEAVTPFNEKTVTLTKTKRGRELLVSQPSDGRNSPISDPAFLAVDSGAVLLFDKATGARIAPRSSDAREVAA
ncbi:MAG: ABC transporter ATP-binding protein [Pseudomonadota bacterium]